MVLQLSGDSLVVQASQPALVISVPAGGLVIPVTPQPSLVVATEGPPGPPGPPGEAGSGAFEYIQASPAATWTITHILGRYPTSVSVIVGGALVDTDIDLPDTSTIVLTFAAPQIGRVEYS